MIDLTVKQTYIILFKSLILYQFKDSENINKILTLWGGNLNTSEQLLYDAISKYFWENAEGAQLDTLGKIIGVERQGRTDSNYSVVLQLYIRLNISSGEIPVLLDALEILFNATEIHYVQAFNDPSGWCKIYTNGDVNLFDEYLAEQEGTTDLILLNRVSDQFLTTESGDILTTENLDPLIVTAPELGDGDNWVFTISDALDESILYRALPAGVGLQFMSKLTTEAGDFLVTESGDYILV